MDGRAGGVTARARAADLGRTYLSLDPAGRERFLQLLAREFDVDHDEVRRRCQTLIEAAEPAQRTAEERALRDALEPPRITLLRQFNALPEGVKFLVDRRAELIDLGRRDPLLSGLEEDLKRLLANWFDIGFLELKRITWESPAALLEKLMVYEAVHEIRGWTDLKNRLDADRRCFAFFHPRMPDEPLIFVEVALVSGMASDVHALLDEAAPIGDPQAADAAIFYSISNCQRGLAGISFGDFLIKRVVDALAIELPRLKIFATLSPVPGFRAWLERQDRSAPGELLLPAERTAIEALGEEAPEGDLLSLLDQEGWHNDPRIAGALREPLLRLCARYLVRERAPSGRALDPVAHFHLSNGARVERLNWLGDVSAKGPAAIRRHHGQLSLPSRRDRGQSRGLSRRRTGRRLICAAQSRARRLNLVLDAAPLQSRPPRLGYHELGYVGRAFVLRTARRVGQPLRQRQRRAWRNWQTHWI